MSASNVAKSTVAQVFFDGVDISDSIRKYLISIIYTDNEEDAADDLQISLHDRDSIWLTQWLANIIDTAAKLQNVLSPNNTPIDAPTVERPVLSRGSEGEDVKYMQQLLVSHGFPLPIYGVDGLFYSETATAVMNFQRAKGLVVTGICNQQTWEILEETHAASLIPGTGVMYKIIADSGAYLRYGPGDVYKIWGRLSFGMPLEVMSISNGWAKVLLDRLVLFISSSYIQEVDNDNNNVNVPPTPGFILQAVFVRKNWYGDGKDHILDCGSFELDAISHEGPPSSLIIKGTSLPYNAQVRKTLKCKAWEAYSLSGIAKEIAKNNGMACMYESSRDPVFVRTEQIKQSDINFLSSLCHDSGISLKITNNIIVLFDKAAYEAKNPIFNFHYGDGSYISWRFQVGGAGKKYASCRVSYINPSTGNVIEGFAYEDSDKQSRDIDGKYTSNPEQQLEISTKVNNSAEAESIAAYRLRLNNKFNKNVQISLPGNPDLLAGITVSLSNCGLWNGKYIISRARHSLSSNGYITDITLRATDG